jgi:phosphatidylserine/phosphatidylglycerophosphate/cardiolipin synthase-like enzyme
MDGVFDAGVCGRLVRAPERVRSAVHNADTRLHAAGPDYPARVQRDLLERHIDAVPSGGSIDWATYYFRDEALAEALVRAHRRGVIVRLCVEKRPRNRRANDRVIERLADPVSGIGGGLAAVGHLLPLHLHTKLYAFSHPYPHAFVGSFNPSGNDPEDPAVVAAIGDQDRGHNLLIELTDPKLVASLIEEVRDLYSSGGSFHRRVNASGAVFRSGSCEGMFLPLLAPNPLLGRFRALEAGASLRIAASHFRDPFMARELGKLVDRGIHVTLLTGSTARRTPRRTERYLAGHGINVRRFAHPDRLPMHSKFMLAQSGGERWACFGSYNLTLSSRWLNHELLMFSWCPQLWRQLEDRWNEIVGSATVGTGRAPEASLQ